MGLVADLLGVDLLLLEELPEVVYLHDIDVGLALTLLVLEAAVVGEGLVVGLAYSSVLMLSAFWTNWTILLFTI